MITIEMNRLDKNGNLPKDQEVYMHFSRGGKWIRGWMKETLKLRSPQHRTVGPVQYTWIIPKSKKNLAVKEALNADTQVVVFQTFNKTVKCTSSCKTATSLIEECDCSCIGKFHGGRNANGDGTELQATVSMPDFSLHIHGQYVTMRTEYRDGQVISRKVLNDAGTFVDVSDEFETE